MEGLDEGVGFGDGGVHLAEEGIDLSGDLGGFTLHGGDGGGVEVVFEVEDVLGEGTEDGFHGGLGGLEGGGQLLIAGTGVGEFASGVGGEGGVGELTDFLFPFGEEIAGDLIHVGDAFADIASLGGATIEIGLELGVGLFEVTPIEAIEQLHAGEGILELGLGLLLFIACLGDGAFEEVALFVAELLHGCVVGGLAAAEGEEDEGGEDGTEGDAHGDHGRPRDKERRVQDWGRAARAKMRDARERSRPSQPDRGNWTNPTENRVRELELGKVWEKPLEENGASAWS